MKTLMGENKRGQERKTRIAQGVGTDEHEGCDGVGIRTTERMVFQRER